MDLSNPVDFFFAMALFVLFSMLMTGLLIVGLCFWIDRRQTYRRYRLPRKTRRRLARKTMRGRMI